MATYSGLLIRDNFQDVGQIPTTGSMTSSPDIIPYLNNNLNWQTAINNYSGPDIGQGVDGSQINNIYVRSLNTATSAFTATVNLYYSYSSLLLTPNNWNQVALPANNEPLVDQNGNQSIQANSYAMLQSPFIIQSLPTPPANTHYCLIAVVNNNSIPFTIPSTFTTNASFAYWVQNNPNVAWRNIYYVPSNQQTNTTVHMFGNECPSTKTMSVIISGSNLSNVNYTSVCNDTRLNQPFSASGSFVPQGEGQYSASFEISVPGNIGNAPDNLQMAMACTFTTTDGSSFPQGTNIQIILYQVPTPPPPPGSSDEEDEYEKLTARPVRIPSLNLENSLGFEVQSLIYLGENTLIFS